MKLKPDDEAPILFYTIDVEEIDGSEGSHALMQRWTEICGTSTIPFDLKERKNLENKASKQISKVLQARRKAEKTKGKKAERDNEE
jgi:hypothetical protein